MGYLLSAVILVLFVAYLIIKNMRSSADRSSGPDISDPTSAPDNIGESDSQSSTDDGDSE